MLINYFKTNPAQPGQLLAEGTVLIYRLQR